MLKTGQHRLTMAQSSNMHAASQLKLVQQQLSELQQQEQIIREQLSNQSFRAVHQLEESSNVPSDQNAAERPLPDLLGEATVLDTGVTYLDRLEARLSHFSTQYSWLSLCQIL